MPRGRIALEIEPDRAGARIHADDPKGKPLELLREHEGRNAELASMMAEIHGPNGAEQAIKPILRG
jgi:hypothetical protein